MHAFEWNDFFKLAQFLQDQAETCGTEEAAVRSAISRTYYAAFGRVCRFASQKLSYEPQSSAADHAGLRRHLQQNQKRQLANDLFHLQQWREQCDYRESVDNLPVILANSRQIAERVFRILGDG